MRKKPSNGVRTVVKSISWDFKASKDLNGIEQKVNEEFSEMMVEKPSNAIAFLVQMNFEKFSKAGSRAAPGL